MMDAGFASSEPRRKHQAADVLHDADESSTEHVEIVPLRAGQVLLRPGDRIEHVHVVEHGLVTLSAAAKGMKNLELAVIGPGGVVGADAVLGCASSGRLVAVEIAGRARRVPTAKFRELVIRDPQLREQTWATLESLFDQFAMTAAAQAHGTVQQRLARWLVLRCHHLDGNELRFTHDSAAKALGVRRPGITVALHELEGAGLLRSHRGHCIIKDPDGLSELAAFRPPLRQEAGAE